MLACATVLGALWALSRSPAFVENDYARGISLQVGRALSIVSGLVPASLAEIALASLVTYALVAIAVVTIHLVRRERSIVNVVLSGGLRTATAPVDPSGTLPSVIGVHVVPLSVVRNSPPLATPI